MIWQWPYHSSHLSPETWEDTSHTQDKVNDTFLFMQIAAFSTYKTKPNLKGKAKKPLSKTSKLLLF